MAPFENFTSVEHPHDPMYQQKRQAMIKQLSQLSIRELEQRLSWQMNQPRTRDDHGFSDKVVQEITTDRSIPVALRKGILDSTGNYTSGGSVMIRQDLEPVWAFSK